MEVQDGKFIIKKGSNCLPVTEGYCPSKRNEAITKDNVLQNDIICDSPSIAAFIARGKTPMDGRYGKMPVGNQSILTGKTMSENGILITVLSKTQMY